CARPGIRDDCVSGRVTASPHLDTVTLCAAGLYRASTASGHDAPGVAGAGTHWSAVVCQNVLYCATGDTGTLGDRAAVVAAVHHVSQRHRHPLPAPGYGHPPLYPGL